MDQIIISFIVLNVLIFFLPSLVRFTGGGYDSFTSFLALGEKSNPKIKDGEWYRLITSVFLHVNVVHLLINMYFLYRIAPTLLLLFSVSFDGFSPYVYLFAFYLLSGIGGSLASFFYNPFPSVGASGALFGLSGVLLAYGFEMQSPQLIFDILLYMAFNIFIAVQLKTIDNAAHVGGFITGFISAMVVLFLV